MARIELKRAREGVNILTLQFELDDEEWGEYEESEEGLFAWLSANDCETVVEFLDRPQRGAVVLNLQSGDVEEGPAEWAFEEVQAVQQKPAEVVAWWEGAQNVARRDRFDQPKVLE